jgi:hypothetical protein
MSSGYSGHPRPLLLRSIARRVARVPSDVPGPISRSIWRELAPVRPQRRERAAEQIDDLGGVHGELVVAKRVELHPERGELRVLLAETLDRARRELGPGKLLTRGDVELDRLVQQLPQRGLGVVRERRALACENGVEEPLAPSQVGEVGLPEPERLREVERPHRVLDPVAETLREARREQWSLAGADQGLHRPTLDRRELHVRDASGTL